MFAGISDPVDQDVPKRRSMSCGSPTALLSSCQVRVKHDERCPIPVKSSQREFYELGNSGEPKRDEPARSVWKCSKQ